MLKHANSELDRVRRFLRDDMWVLDPTSFSRARRYVLNLIKVIYIVLKGFVHDRCALHASALTFITLLSVVPVLALSMMIAESLNFRPRFIEILTEHMEGVPSQVQGYIQQLMDMVQSTNFLAMGLVGIVFLIWVYIRAMNKIEVVLNMIWGVHERRKMYHEVTLYIGLMFLVTIMFLVAASFNAVIRSQKLVQEMSTLIDSRIIQFFLEQLSILGIVAALVALYMFIPNTKVNIKSAMVGAIIAGILWLAWQKLCIRFQVGITSYGIIYGAFASIPITLYWMYVNWIVVLLGAELSFACQNMNTYSLELDAGDVSQALRRRLAFHVVFDICKKYKQGEEHWNSDAFRTQNRVPIRLLNDILQLLKDSDLVADLADGQSWVPARSMNRITMRDIEEAVRGAVDGRFKHIGQLPIKMAKILQQHEKTYFTDLGNRSFADLLENEDLLKETQLEKI